jgi:integrase
MTDQAFQVSTVPHHLRLPKYRLHKASGQAVVTLRGRDVYLGEFNTPASHEKYQATIAEFIAGRGVTAEERAHITVAELILHYWRYAQESYSRETLAGSIKPALSRLRRLFGCAGVADFGPLKLKAFRQSLLDETGEKGEHLSRPYINRLVRQVRSLFKWGVGEELVPPSVYHGLLAVEGIRYGRTRAPEPEPVTPVADAVVNATVPHLCSVVGDMVRLQRLTGMRPGEVCRMTTGERQLADRWTIPS